MRAAVDRPPSPTRDWSRLLGEIELAASASAGEATIVYGSADRSAAVAATPPAGARRHIDSLIHW